MNTIKILRKVFLCIGLLFAVNMYAQKIKAQDYKSLVTSSDVNYFDIVAQKRAEFALMDLSVKANNKAMKQFERWAYIWRDRVNGDGTFPTAANQSDKDQLLFESVEASRNNTRMPGHTWEQVGPLTNPAINGYTLYPGKGRVNVVAADPTNTNIMYAGAAAGGIWKTTDNGTNWAPKSDNLAGLGVSDILVDPNNTNIIYMATGDADGKHISSIGVFKSIDAGETWNATGLVFTLNENDYITDLVFAPGSSTTIFALTSKEVKRSTDSGVTWTNITVTHPGLFIEGFQNIIFDPNDANKVVLSDRYEGLYFSTNGGSSFAMHATIQGGELDKKLKIVSSAADNDFFYGINQDGVFKKFRYAFTDTAADLISFTMVADFDSQGGYDLCIAISPTNANNIVVAGVRGLRSIDNGATFSLFSNPYNEPPGVGFYVHADHHHFSFLADGVTLLNGNDAGVNKGSFASNDGADWLDLSPKLMITQPYHISVTQEANGDNFMMGNQDNDGFSKILKNGTRQWVSCLAGDGTGTGIDIANSNIRYLGGTKGLLHRSDNGYADGYNQSITILDSNNSAAFISPFEQHPTNPNIIYAGYGDVNKSINKGTVFSLTGSGIIETNFLNVTLNGPSVRIYAIGDNGAKRSDDDGGTWTVIDSPSTPRRLNSFAAVPNSTTVYATISSYSAGNKIFKSTDNGSTWTNISGNLPNIVMKKIFFKNDSIDETLYVGTELGVYWKNDTMINWEKLGEGLPNVRISDLEMNYTDQELYVGTFGRSMWKISTEPSCPGVTKTWNGTIWAPIGVPGDTDTVVINGNYNTTTNGSIDACTLSISGTSTVTIEAGTYISVQGETIIDTNTTLNIEHQGSFVQVDDAAVVTNNGTINVNLTTPALSARDFLIMGSPMTAEDDAMFSAYQVLNHTTANFTPYVGVPPVVGVNFHDQESNDWSNYTGALSPGEGYFVRPSYTAGGTYNYVYDAGTLNNGVITYTAFFGDDKEDSPNVMSNPYPSAINADLLISSNTIVDELYFWEHNTTPAVGVPGPLSQNFNMEDISTRNFLMGVAAATGGGVPSNIISTGQGFGIKANAAGDVTFNNALRLTTGNGTIRQTLEKDLLWIEVRENTYGMGSTAGIGFTEGATPDLDAGYDTMKLGTVVSMYSHLEDGSQQLGIQGREAFDTSITIPMGFSTLIEADAGIPYVINISGLEGANIEQATVYLIDHLASTITNLSTDRYEFLSDAGTFDNRFTLQFKTEVLGSNDPVLDAVSIYPNSVENILNIVSPKATVTAVAVYDVRGRVVSERIFTSEGNNYQVDLSALETALYFVKITTESGTITKRIVKQ